MQKSFNIQRLISCFKNEFNLIPVIGMEIEFYLDDIDLLERLKSSYDLVEESGVNQYEIRTKPTIDIEKALLEIKNLQNLEGANFNAKPFSNQPGSALHFHVNFLDQQGQNVFEQSTADQESDMLLYCAYGMLETLPEAMQFLAPLPEDYARYVDSIETPSTISWGNNNRTVAIRIPPNGVGGRRLEHRVTSANAEPFVACSAILSGALHGFRERKLPPEKIFGNAYLEQYGLRALPKSLDEAKTYKGVLAEILGL